MNRNIFSRSVAVACLASLVGVVLAGCAAKNTPDASAKAQPSDQKMGNDYAQGLAQMHSQAGQRPQTTPAPNHQ